MSCSCWSTAPTGMRSKPSSTEAVSGLGVSATVSTREDADAVRVLYEDIDNDQRFWNALSALVLLAAALAAFNLINRIVEAQRREIGIGMALGVPRPQLAVRPDADRRPGRGAGHGRRPRRRAPRGQRLREPPRVVPATARPPHTVPVRRVSPGRHARDRDPDRRQRDPGLAGAARRADRGDPHRSPGGQDQSADRLDRPTPTARFDHDADADPQRAAHPTPHGADRRRCRRRDHRSGGRARDARQLRPDPRSGKRRVHQGRRRPCRRTARHLLPERLPCRRSDLRCSRRRTHRCRTASARHRARTRTRQQPRSPRRVRRSRPARCGRRPSRRARRRPALATRRSCWPARPPTIWEHRSATPSPCAIRSEPRPAASRSPTPSSSSPASTPTRSGRSPSWTSPTPPSSGWRVS